MSKKRIIQAESDEQIKNFVSTYKYWAILDGSDELANSNIENVDFEKELIKAIDVGIKRGRQYLVIRVGSNEYNSRTNDEMVISLSNYTNPITEQYAPNTQPNAPIILSGLNKPLNNTGITATEMQTYLNGALERQQKEFEAMNKSTLAGLQAEMKKQQAEQEIALLKQMHEQQMNFERQLLQREREELERKQRELEVEREEFEFEKQENKEGIKGFVSTLAGFGRDLVDDVLPKKDKEDTELKGTENIDTSNVDNTETLQFEDTETNDNNEADIILDGIEKMSKEDLQVIQELLAEKLKDNNTEKNKEFTNDKTQENE